ncbi:TldD protein [Escherichia coli]|nr:TldD protein [Escherichia coli]
MSLNLVSEQLLAANGLKHQDLFAILGQLVPNVALIMAISIFSRAITNPGF